MQTKPEKREERIKQSIPASDFMPKSKDAQSILQARAKLLAKHLIKKEKIVNAVECITFLLGEKAQYAIPYEYLSEVISRVNITKIPNTPRFVVGAINHRGALIAVIDLNEYLYNRAIVHNPHDYIVIVSFNHVRVGVLVDSIIGSHIYDPAKIDLPLSLKSEFIIGLYQGNIAIIDIPAIFKKLKVNRKEMHNEY